MRVKDINGNYINNAIEAMEKQIPKIPTYEGDGYADGMLVYDEWLCPKCKGNFKRLLALSRIDNKTMICDECGTKEALDALGLIEGSSMRIAIIEASRKGRENSAEN